ncbi:sensor histidine kinase [Cycloclasticus pugetii]|uniref:sensor histidine kinase n=1 Tax=Cycloclasticus pugetii TaxID=34068 RepID=UPI000919BFAB|nr:ATP-binding protein [Cycloclasticus pugetii]SHJ01000.1 PAS/PAC sensor signal transduction histidine kinase [Cycloclasticus pugetii]
MSLLATSDKVHQSQPLEDAFHAFNQVSQHLTESYQQLEQQVVVLSDALAQSNSEKIQHLSDKEALATQLEGLIEAIPGAVIVLDVQQKVVKLNACARSWVGGDVLGLPWDNVQTNYLIPDEQLADQFSLKTGQIVALSTTSLGRQSGSVVLLTDITQQRELHQQLEHKKKLAEMGEFSAGLAHQIRTPLASALLYASQLNTGVLSHEAQQIFAAKLLDRLRLLNTQITDMLNYSHHGEFVKQPVKLTTFIKDLSDLYQDKPVVFEGRDAEESIQLYISKNALLGAIGNLLDNALDAIKSGESVTCSISLNGDANLRITVADQGHGLSKKQQQRIFEPFYTNKANGTGLGLAVVSNVVNAHAGDIKWVSKVGVGTTMDVQLPVVMSSSMKQLQGSM